MERKAWVKSFRARQEKHKADSGNPIKRKKKSHPQSPACYGCLLEFLLTNKGLVVGMRDEKNEEENYDADMMLRKYARQKRFYMEVVRWCMARQKESHPFYHLLPRLAAGLYSECLSRICTLGLDVKKVQRISENYELFLSPRMYQPLQVNYFDLRAAIKPDKDDDEGEDEQKSEQAIVIKKSKYYKRRRKKKGLAIDSNVVVKDEKVGLFILQHKDLEELFNSEDDHESDDDDDFYSD